MYYVNMQNKIISAFANPVRLKIICCLQKNSKNVEELISTCNLAQSAVSQHLKKLKNAGLIKDTKKGKYVYYSLVYPKTAVLAKEIQKFLKKIEKL